MPRSVPHHPIPVYYDAHYCAPAIRFETFKKAASIAAALTTNMRLKPLFDVRSPVESKSDLEAAEAEVIRYLDPTYLNAIKTGSPSELAASNGLGWDPALYRSTLHSTAGILRALADVEAGASVAASLSSGLHHATPTSGSGYCTVNSLAIAGLVASRNGLNVTILDLDAHCGGGTESFLRRFQDDSENVRHVDLALIPFDRYEQRYIRSWFRIGTRDTYVNDLHAVCSELIATRPDIVLYNAGVDIWPTVDKEVVRQRDQLVAQTLSEIGSKCVVVMAGGYGSDDDIVPLHTSTLEAFGNALRRPAP